MKKFDYQGALKEGYSEEEIMNFLAKNNPNFDFENAQKEGYSPQEINQFLSSYSPKEKKPEKSLLEKGARLAGQYALGRLEGSPIGMAYDMPMMAQSSQEAQNIPYREMLGEELESLMERKAMGDWSDEDEKFLQHITEQIKDPRKSMEYVKTDDLTIRGLAEKISGQDLTPEGILEKSANWTGMLKSAGKDLVKLGTSPKEVAKYILPGMKDVTRGLTAGTALQMAEMGNFGPMGTMAAAIVGDLAGGGISALTKAVTHPKQTLAKGFSLLSNTKSSIKEDLKDAASKTEFTKDLGTLTDNSMVQMIQAKLSASGYTGKPLAELRKKMTQEIVDEYENIAQKLGKERFASAHEAGEVTRDVIKKIKDAEYEFIRDLYSEAEMLINETSKVKASKLLDSINRVEKNLKPGKLKSTQQKATLDILSDIKKDISDGYASVKDLMNNKIALNDMINYEVQGGTKQLLKGIVSDLDRAIISYGEVKPLFAKRYVQANKNFSEHAKTFRNKNIDDLIRMADPEKMMSKMNSIQGIRDLKVVLEKSPEGKKIFDSLKRFKLDNMIGNNMKDGITEQIKSGKFFNLLEKPKNKEILKEILSPEAYKKIINLQKHVGKLQQTAQKFFNASQTATASADMAVTSSILGGVASLLMGNPWVINTLGLIGGAKVLSSLMADPKFLKMVEESINIAASNKVSRMSKFAKKMAEYTRPILQESIVEQSKSIE